MTVRVLDKEGFRTLVASLTELSDGATTWDLDPTPQIGETDRARVLLTVFSIQVLGVDEHRSENNPGGYPAGSYVTTELGNRHIVIQIKAESYDKSVESAELIDQIRTRIRSRKSTDALNALNLAYVWAERTTNLPTTYDQRVVNVAAADFTFGGIAQYVSDVQLNQGWIDTVDGNNVIPGTLTE